MWGATRLLAIAACATLIHAGDAGAGDSGWQSLKQLRGIVRTTRARGEIPVSLDCRPGSGGAFAPKQEMRVVSRPNSEKRNWVVYATPEGFRPGKSPSEWNDWKMISSKNVSGSGRATTCYLFHHKKAGTVTPGAPPLTKRTSGGWMTVN